MSNQTTQQEVPPALNSRKSFRDPPTEIMAPTDPQLPPPFQNLNKENKLNSNNSSSPTSALQNVKSSLSNMTKDSRPLLSQPSSRSMSRQPTNVLHQRRPSLKPGKSSMKITPPSHADPNQSMHPDQTNGQPPSIEPEDFLTKALANMPSSRASSGKQVHITQLDETMGGSTTEISPAHSHAPSAKSIRRLSLRTICKASGSQFTRLKTTSEYKTTSIPFLKSFLEKRKRMITIDGIQHDLERIISNVFLKTKRLQQHQDLVSFFSGELYDKFIKSVVKYARNFLREKLALVYELGIKTTTLDVPSSLIHFLTEFNKNEILSVQEEDLYKLHQDRTKSFFEFASIYFEILVYQRKVCKTQTRERMIFEKMYTITVDIVCQLLSSYNLSYIIINELNRCFRTDFFKPSLDDLLKDPQNAISFRFLTSLKSPFENPPLTLSGPTKAWDKPSHLPDQKGSSNRNASITLPTSSLTTSDNNEWKMRKKMLEMGSYHLKSQERLVQPIQDADSKKRANISLNMVRSLRSPLGEACLPVLV